jgi:hypothetical protein
MYLFLNSVTWIILTLLCAQYPSQQSNGNIVMESVTGRVICGKKETTDQYTNHNYQWCEINISLFLTSDVLNSAL